MTPLQLEAELTRCTRKDGTIGLVSLCTRCHHKADRKRKYTSSEKTLRARKRNRRLDDAAKIARGECECDEKCHRAVTAEDVDMFEWDHLVQSFDDPDYRTVSSLVHSTCSTARCDRERAKCRLLYIKCHHAHSVKQRARRRVVV
jgi:hypothetical protein